MCLCVCVCVCVFVRLKWLTFAGKVREMLSVMGVGGRRFSSGLMVTCLGWFADDTLPARGVTWVGRYTHTSQRSLQPTWG